MGYVNYSKVRPQHLPRATKKNTERPQISSPPRLTFHSRDQTAMFCTAIFTFHPSVHCRTGGEGPDGEWRYRCTLSLTSALDRGGLSAPQPVPSRTHRVGGWVGPRGPVWTGAEIFTHNGVRSPDLAARSESLYRLLYSGCPSV